MSAAIETNRPVDLLGRTLKDLVAWVTRRPVARPGEVVIGHSGTLRTNVFLLVGMEVLVEALMDVKMIPPALRPYHFLWMALMIDLSTVFAALTKRNPHRIGSTALHIRAGLYEEITVPLVAIRAVRREIVSAGGRGVRPVPGRAEAVMCTIAGPAEIAVDLVEPMDVRLANGSTVRVRQLCMTADVPGTAHRELARALRTADSE